MARGTAERHRGVVFFEGTTPAARIRRVHLPTPSRHQVPPRPIPMPGEVRDFLAWLLASAGLELKVYRGSPLMRRLAACLRSLRCRSIADVQKHLQRQPADFSVALSALLIGATEFFRDEAVFTCLDQLVLPRLMAGRRGIRVWSAGCADGSELYSVAMLLARRRLLEHSYLLGSDCRADAIAKAARGWFAPSQLVGLGADWRDNHFAREGTGWRASDALRRSVHWRQENLLADASPSDGDWDLILCRNVAIYLESAATAALWSRLITALRPGGVLVVGRAERPEVRLPLARLAPCVFRKKE